MTGDPTRPPLPPHTDKSRISGGFPIAICTIIGVLAGGLNHQMSIGMLSGFGAGVLIAIALWLWDRRR